MPEAQVDMTVPKQEMPGSGVPLTKINLPDDLMQRIKASATSTAPAEKVSKAQGESKAGVAPAAPAATPAPPAEAKPAAAAPAAAKPAEPAKPAAPPAEDKPAKKDGISQVREALERAEAKARELEGSLTATAKEKADAFAKVADYEGKLKNYEDRISKELEPLKRVHEETAKKLQEREEALRIRDYTATTEWHDRYVKPITAVQQEAASVLAELAVQDEQGNMRAATLEDFNRIHSAPSLNAAEVVAKKLFGDGFATTELVRHSARLRSLVRTQQEALKNAQLESTEYFKRQQEQQQLAQAQFKQRVEQKVQQYAVRPVETDPEEVAAFRDGMEFAERVEAGSQDPETWADMVARVKATAASDKLKDLRLKRVAAENEALRKELEAYRRNEPAVETTGGGAASEVPSDSQEAAKQGLRSSLMAAARKAATGR